MILLKMVLTRLKNCRIYRFISYEVDDNKIEAESIDSASISEKVMHYLFKELGSDCGWNIFPDLADFNLITSINFVI